MKISLENIAKVREANIEINGITVIAGENNTGKSTVGKALFAVFNSFYNIYEAIEKEREKLIATEIQNFIRTTSTSIFLPSETRNFAMSTAKQINIKKDNFPLKDFIIHELTHTKRNIFLKKENFDTSSEAFKELIVNISEILELEKEAIFQVSFQNSLLDEFSGQINNLLNDDSGKIELTIAKKNITAMIRFQQIEKIDGEILDLYTRAIYIDDPFILDNMRPLPSENKTHKEYLISILTYREKRNLVKDALIESKLKTITEKLNAVFEGEIMFSSIFSQVHLNYRLKGSSEKLDIKNLSAGLKTFAILKTLFNNGALEKNGTIILDEPEIHLHPEWQLKFAEIIVLFQKELNLHILLTTHSPYFLRAIQVYAGNYGIAGKCKYYLAENVGAESIIKDVSNNPDLIFKKLTRPLQSLEDLMYD